MGTVMLVTTPLPITSLASLLRLEPTDILQALLGIQSILMIPGNDNEPIRLFHTSLRDFSNSQPRSGDFYINPPNRHLCIANDCLKVIGSEAELEDGHFYTGVQVYASVNWCHHFQKGLEDAEENLLDSSLSAVMEFASGPLDLWVNTVILNGDMNQLLKTLSSCQQISNCPDILKSIESHTRV